MTPFVIGITGRARHGKDTLAGLIDYELQSEGWTVTRVGFADALRAMALAANPLIADGVRYTEAMFTFGYEAAKERYPEVRGFLQRLGTEAARGVLGDDVWVQAFDRAVRGCQSQFVIVADVRFENEADYVLDNGELFGVRRIDDAGRPYPNGLADHPSEAYVETALGLARYVATHGSLTRLRQHAEVIADVVEAQANGGARVAR